MTKTINGKNLALCVLGMATSSHVVARARAFQHMGHTVSLLSPIPGTVEGMKVTSCFTPGSSGFFAKLLRVLKVLGVVSRARGDVFHVHYAAELTSWAAALLGKQPLVVSVMGGDVLFDEQSNPGPLSRALTILTLKRARLVTVKSKLLAEVVAGFGVVRDRIMVTVWGVDQNLFKPDPGGVSARRDEWNANEDARILFSPRILQPLYNQHLMIEAMPAVLAKVPEALLVISTYCQDDAYRVKLEQTARDLGVAESVRFVPGIEYTGMPASYSASELTLGLPPSDGFPQSVLEGMACGTVAVLGDLERYRELLSDNETACFTKLEPTAIGETIIDLLEDGAKRDRMERAGIELVADKANLEHEARRVEERIIELVENHG